MVNAIGGTTATTSTLVSAASGGSVKSQIAALQAQISAKQSEVDSAKDEKAKADAEAQLAALKAQLAALELQQSQEQQATGGSSAPTGKTDEADAVTLLSGESDKIGTKNYDDETPFGERYTIV